MKKFKVEISRIGYGNTSIVVEANDITKAENKAIDEVGDHEFSEHTYSHSICSVEEIEEQKTILRENIENWSVEKKDIIETMLINMWAQIGMDIPTNYEDIVQDCYEDVCETADPLEWHSGDVAIAFRRWIEKQII